MTLSKQTINLTTQKDIMECLATIKSLHPNWNDSTPELTLKLWHYQLKDYPVNDVKKVILDLASTMKFVPKLADVLAILNAPKGVYAHAQLPCDGWDRLIEHEKNLGESGIQMHRVNASLVLNGEDVGDEMDRLRAKLISEMRELLK